jgi:hypothetical protein
MTQTTATATHELGRYTIKVDDQVIEFNHKLTFAYVVIGRCPSVSGWGGVQRHWTVWARTNQPRGAEQKWTTWGRRQVDGAEVEVLVIPVEH